MLKPNQAGKRKVDMQNTNLLTVNKEFNPQTTSCKGKAESVRHAFQAF